MSDSPILFSYQACIYALFIKVPLRYFTKWNSIHDSLVINQISLVAYYTKSNLLLLLFLCDFIVMQKCHLQNLASMATCSFITPPRTCPHYGRLIRIHNFLSTLIWSYPENLFCENGNFLKDLLSHFKSPRRVKVADTNLSGIVWTVSYITQSLAICQSRPQSLCCLG